MCDLTDSCGNAIVDDQQIIVCVERKLVRIEWAFCLARCLHQRFGKRSSRTKCHCAQNDSAEETASRTQLICCHRSFLCPNRFNELLMLREVLPDSNSRSLCFGEPTLPR
jgi:hypothetical protein